MDINNPMKLVGINILHNSFVILWKNWKQYEN